jgi:hypothetical protein
MTTPEPGGLEEQAEKDGLLDPSDRRVDPVHVAALDYVVHGEADFDVAMLLHGVPIELIGRAGIVVTPDLTDDGEEGAGTAPSSGLVFGAPTDEPTASD